MEEESTIPDKIDGIIFPLPLEEKFKCWELIEELIKERLREHKSNKNYIDYTSGAYCSYCAKRKRLKGDGSIEPLCTC
jgi:hypothetical protein